MKEKIKSQEDGRKNFPCSEICRLVLKKIDIVQKQFIIQHNIHKILNVLSVITARNWNNNITKH